MYNDNFSAIQCYLKKEKKEEKRRKRAPSAIVPLSVSLRETGKDAAAPTESAKNLLDRSCYAWGSSHRVS